MPIVDVKQIRAGAKLAEEVYTSLGGLLFAKGTILHEREKEILEAFLISRVEIEENEDNVRLEAERKEQPKAGAVSQKPSQGNKPSFHQSFDQAVAALRKLFIQVESGSSIPVMQIREVISPFILQFQDQPHVLLPLSRTTNVDRYPYEHAVAVGVISYMIAKWMKVPEKEWMQIALAGTLLDVGKARIDHRILSKPGKLSADEFEEMKRHTLYGYQIIKAAHGLNEGVALAALQHHEREDGSGYPMGLPGSKLHLYSKITAVADVYHAMCSDRVYQKAASPYIVAEQLVHDSFGKLDPIVVHTFVKGITQLAVGTLVELSDGKLGKIVFTDSKNPTRPMVETGGKIVNLAETRQLSIVKVVEQ
jgi:HD-GYP domain-containing protein (c-di-GMP phosphodiesterase class II)